MLQKLITVLLLIFLSFVPAWATLPAGVNWEIRTTGNDSNGGGFVSGASGTDFSQQDAAQYTFTNLVTANGTTNPCAVTSISHNFVASDVGNLMQITAGTNWTTGFYQIVSVAANAATLDRNCASAAAATGGTFAVGGGLATIQKAISSTGPIVGGNIVWTKSGTYTVTTSITMLPSGFTGGSDSFVWEGYNTTHGDLGTKPLITTATNSIKLVDFNLGAPTGHMFINLSFSSTAGTRGDGFHATVIAQQVVINNCTFDGFNVAINGDFAVDFDFEQLRVFNSEIKNSVSHGMINSSSTLVINSYFHNNGGDGFKVTRTGRFPSDVITGSVFYSNGANGFNISAAADNDSEFQVQNSVFSNNTSAGIVATAATSAAPFVFINNILYSNGTYGIDMSNAFNQAVLNYNNAYGANTTAPRHNLAVGTGDVTLTADPFVGRTSNNFALNSTAGGGAALKGVGFPGVTLNMGTGALDVGALQTAASTSTGANAAFVQ